MTGVKGAVTLEMAEKRCSYLDSCALLLQKKFNSNDNAAVETWLEWYSPNLTSSGKTIG